MTMSKSVQRRVRRGETPVVSAEAVTLLRKVEKAILKEPRRLDMFHFAENYVPKEVDPEFRKHIPPCHTTACIAGHVVLLSPKGVASLREYGNYRKDKKGVIHLDGLYMFHWADEAIEILGITRGQSRRLFFVDQWPEEYRKAYDHYRLREDHAGMARVTVDRIEYFISTGK